MVELSYVQRNRIRQDRLLSQKGIVLAHNVMVAFDLVGHLQMSALERAVDDVVRRHSGLRLVVQWDMGEALGDILRDGTASIMLSDASEDEVDGLLNEEADTPFDSARDVKFRLRVIRKSDSAYTVAIIVDHLVCDGDSLYLLVSDLSMAYAARIAGKAPVWWSSVEDYASFAETEVSTLTGANLESRLTYWKGLLDPLMAVPETIMPGAIDPGKNASAALITRAVEGLTTRITAAAQTLRLTPFAIVTAGLALAVYSAQPISVVSLMVPVRYRPERWFGTVGWFANTTIQRHHMPSDRPLGQLARDILIQTFQSCEETIPLGLLVQRLQPERHRIRRWRPEIFLDLQDIRNLPCLTLDGSNAARRHWQGGGRLRDGVAICVELGPNTVSIDMRYERESWPQEKAEAFFCSLLNAIEIVTSDPSLAVGEAAIRLRQLS